MCLMKLADLQSHLLQAQADLSTYIPNKTFHGLAVIDWEDWRPIFERNNYNRKQRAYLRASAELVRERHPDWSDDKIYNQARKEFEDAARNFMQSTLSLCRKERPGGFWGFYGFPGCYNYRRGQGTCANDTREFNDQLRWMFSSSSVLVPSVYLDEWFGSHDDRRLHVHGTLEETRRVRQKYAGMHVPVLPYTRFKYADSGAFYDEADLSSTIQQSGYAGFNGVTIWGSSSSFESEDDCEDVRDYVQDILGPFVKHTTEFMVNCSSIKCNSHGRCLNATWITDYAREKYDAVRLKYLFTRLLQFILSFIYGGVESSPYDNFTCECYQGWAGPSCAKHEPFYRSL